MSANYMVHPCSAQEVQHYLRKNGRSAWLQNVRFCLGLIDGVTIAPRMIAVAALGMCQPNHLRSPYMIQLHAIEHDQRPEALPFIYRAALTAASSLGYHYVIQLDNRDAEFLPSFGFQRRGSIWAACVVANPIGWSQAAPDPAAALPDTTASGYLDI